MPFLVRTVFFIFFYFCSTFAFADYIVLKNGDRITAEILEQNKDSVKIKHPLLGEMTIDQKAIERVEDEEKQTSAPLKSKYKNWSHKMSAGYQTSRGNNRTTWVSLGLNSRYQKGRNEWMLRGDMLYGNNQEKMIAQRFFGKIENDYRLQERSKWYTTRSVELDHDRFSNIDYRLIPSTGIGYWFSENKNWTAELDTSLGYEYTNYGTWQDQEQKNQGTLVLVPHVYLNKRLFKNTKLTHDLSLYPGLTSTNYFRWRSETSLINPISAHLDWKISLLDEYNSRPASLAKKNDLTMTSSIEYSF